MAYQSSGTLTTDKRPVDVSTTWDSKTEWEAYQSKNNVTISNGVLTLVDVSAPTEGLLHQYDWSASGTTTTTVPDQEGTADLTGSFTDLTGSINGVQAGTFDGTDDAVDASYSGSTQPLERFIVLAPNSATGTQVFLEGTSANFQTYINAFDNWSMNAGSTVEDNAADTNPHIITSAFNGASSVLRVDGTQVASGDAGTNDPGGMTVGKRRSNENYFNGLVGEVLEYDPNASGYSRTDVESYLSSKWGITV